MEYAGIWRARDEGVQRIKPELPAESTIENLRDGSSTVLNAELDVVFASLP